MKRLLLLQEDGNTSYHLAVAFRGRWCYLSTGLGSCHPPQRRHRQGRGPRRQPLGGAEPHPSSPGGGETEYQQRCLKFAECVRHRPASGQRDSLAGQALCPTARPGQASQSHAQSVAHASPRRPPMSSHSPSAPPLPACGCLSWSPAVNQHESRDSTRHQTFRRIRIRGLRLGLGHLPGQSFRGRCGLTPGEPLGVTTADCGPYSQVLGTRQ